jgi:hypothetical protein
MALAAETKRVVSLFEYSDNDVNKAVKEFLRQMGMCDPNSPRLAILMAH